MDTSAAAAAAPVGDNKPTHLQPSELGTKEYWDQLYDREIQNHTHDPSDTGTVWFDDSDAEARVVDFLSDRHAELLLPPPHSPQNNNNDNNGESNEISFLDLGTGNGSLLFGLRDAGFARGRMLGVDYSARSVEFARRIARSRRAEEKEVEEGAKDEEEKEVEFQLHDILRDSPSRLLLPTGNGDSSNSRGWDVVLDKGTFDAVSLSSEEIPIVTSAPTSDGRRRPRRRRRTRTTARISEAYPRRVLPLVREGGLLVVTSCNWTEDELRRWFVDFGLDSHDGAAEEGEGEGEDVVNGQDAEEEEEDDGNNMDVEAENWRFEQVGRVEYPSFSFGGVKGQTISTLCFRKVKR